MTHEEMRVAIAEECGAKRRPDLDYILFAPVYVAGNTVEMWEINGSVVPRDKLPNYPADLDACAEFEAMMPHSVYHDEYIPQLEVVCFRDETSMVSAKAPQRCEAFLRMRGKWKE